jgi:hypothetical protein
MKQYFLFLVSALFLLSSLSANPSLKDSKEIHDISKKICAKMSECVKKETAKLPPEQRKMMESMFPSGDICTQQYMKNASGSSENNSDDKGKKISKEEIEAMKKCLQDINKTSCESLMSGENPKSCEQVQE